MKNYSLGSNLHKIPGSAYLWSAVIIFAAANSITRKLTEIGSQHLIDGRNPISFCNVLFIGNLCALLVFILIYWRQLSVRSFQQLSPQDWASTVAVALLSGALAPGVIFAALSSTMVNNVVLIGRIEPPLTLALAIWLLKERTNRWEIVGAIVSFAGVVITVVLQGLEENIMTSTGFINIGWGEILTAIGAVAVVASNIISKTRLNRIPIGLFSIIKTAIGTVVFFFTALYIYGSHHFMDALSPFLWKWMLLYGTLIVVVGQSFWLAGLKKSSGSLASLISAFNPIAAFAIAYLILGEAPTKSQIVGGAIILCGIVLGQLGTKQTTPPILTQTNHALKMNPVSGFKGM